MDESLRTEVSAQALSFDAIFVREHGRLVRLAFALCGRRDLAEEEVQEAFVAALRRWDRISRYDDPAAWLRRVVVNRCVSVSRRKATELKLMLRLRAERLPEPELPPSDDLLWDAVRELPRRQRQVIALVFVEDLSVAEVARILECAEETVRTHLRRGRAGVAAALGESKETGR